jgi:hypothetical protein
VMMTVRPVRSKRSFTAMAMPQWVETRRYTARGPGAKPVRARFRRYDTHR